MRTVRFFALAVLCAIGLALHSSFSLTASIDSGAWSTKAPLPGSRPEAAGAAAGGVVYVIGGHDSAGTYVGTVDAYTPATNSWASPRPAAMPTPRALSGTAAVDGIVYVIGGYVFANGRYFPSNTVEAYNPATNTWTRNLAAMPTARWALSVAVLDGKLYAFGGSAGGAALATVEAYDPVANVWTAKTPLQQARFFPAVGAIGEKIYVVGSDNGGGIYSNTVEEYDPNAVPQTSVFKAPIPTPRGNAAYAVIGGVLYVAGGTTTGYVRTNAVEGYHPSTNSWSSLATIPTVRDFIPAGVVNGVLYAIGGYNPTVDSYITTNEAFTPPGAATSITGVAGSGTYGTPASLTATLTSGGVPMSGKTVSFTLSGTPVGGATTDTNGIATLNGVGLAGIAASSTPYANAVGASFGGDSSGLASSGTGDLIVARATPILAWTPAALTYGTPLGAGQLNALATASINGSIVSVPGAFAYTPGVGAIVNAGNQILSTTFTPADGGNFNSVTTQVLVSVAKAVQTIAIGAWQSRAAMSIGRLYAAAGVVNGQLFVTGNYPGAGLSNRFDVYDPGANAWTNLAPMPTERYLHAVAGLNGVLYTLGGPGLNTMDAYDPATRTWSAKAPMSISRYGGAAAAANGLLYAIGGQGPDGAFLNSVEAYDPATNTWSPRASMPTPRSSAAAGVVDGKIYVVGGTNCPGCNYLDTVEAYDPVTDTWGTKPPMPTPRYLLGVGVLNGALYAVGGYNANARRLDTVEIYVPAAGAWATGAPMPTARNGLAVGVVNGALYAAGGEGPDASFLTTNESFGALGDRTFGDADFPISATASSGLPAALAASGACTLSGTTVHLTGAGSCTITASQSGDANHTAASAAQTFSIAKAAQTITFGALTGKTYGDADFTVSATASSGLAVSFAAAGNCTVSGAAVHITGAGSCTITASQAGDANYAAAPSVQQPFTIAQASQTITFGSLVARTFGDPNFTVSATASSGLAVSFAAAGNCTVSGASVHITGAGSCTITASQSGNANYSAAANVPQPFAIAKANQTITSFGFTLKPAFSTTGTMGTPRVNPVVLRLFDGTMLVAGGSSQPGGAVLASAERYDPAAGTFAATGSLTIARTGAAFTRLVDGRILLAGGSDGTTTLKSAELYDLSTGTFSPTGDLNIAREGASAWTLDDGTVLVVGGATSAAGDSASAEIYDPGAGTFTRIADMHVGRPSSPSAVELSDATVLIVGGTTATGAAEVFDPATWTFHQVGSLATPRVLHSATPLPDGRVLVAGGFNGGALSSTELYDPTTQTFVAGPPMTAPHYAHVGIGIPGGGVLIAGGSDAVSASAVAEVYGNDRFVAIQSMTVGRVGARASGLPGAPGRVLVVGGSGTGSNGLASADVLRFTGPAAAALTLPLPDRPFVAPDGSVNATASSGLAVQFSAAGSCLLTGAPLPLHVTAPGTCTVTASQTGNTNYNAAPSVSQTFTVHRALNMTTVASSANPATAGQTITFTSTVTPFANTTVVPSGTITFTDGGVAIGTATLDATGTATFSTSALSAAASPHTIRAQYSGDGFFIPESSAPLAQTIQKADTVTVLVSSLSSATYGHPTTLTATVTSPAGVPTGTVTFHDAGGTIVLGPDGRASLRLIDGVGSHTYTAEYNGDANFAPSVSAPVSATVTAAPTTVTISSSNASATVGDAVTLTAVVTGTPEALSGSGQPPQGLVAFTDGSGPSAVTLGTPVLQNGVATLTTSALAVGAHSISASYGGDAVYATSVSAPFVETIAPPPVMIRIVPAPTDGTIAGPGGLRCGSGGTTCAATVPNGTTVTLSASADSGRVFGGWTGACASNALQASCTLTLTIDTTAGALFNPRPTTLTVDSGADLGDARPGDGICATSAGVCTLRAAVQEANALGTALTIGFGPALDGTPITVVAALAVTNPAGLTINGNGAASTIVQGCDAQANPSCVGADRLVDLADGARLTLGGITLRNGSADGAGGGAIRVGAHLPWEPGYGGPSALVLSDALLLDNRSASFGGAIVTIGSVTITNTRFVGNQTVNYGGAISAGLESTLSIANSTFSGNQAVAGGAIFTNASGAVTIAGSTFNGNQVTYDGGALSLNEGGPYSIANSTLSGNSVSGSDPTIGGGAIFAAAAQVHVASATINGNGAPVGGAIDSYQGAVVTLTNTIVAGGSGGTCVTTVGGGITSAGYNLTDDASCGFTSTGDLLAAAKLGPLADNGGPTFTHALLAGSPAINAGNPAGCTDLAGTPLTTDQRGQPRVQLGRCDVGAYESAKLSQTLTFPAIADRTDADPLQFTVSAGASSGLAVAFAARGACTVSGNTVQIQAVGRCTITASQDGDETYYAAAPVDQPFVVRDTTAPSISIVSPGVDDVIGSSPVSVTVHAADFGGVTSLFVNGVEASMISGGAHDGLWQAAVPVALPVAAGSALTFTATARDAASNSTSASVVVDNDGIDAAIDADAAAYTSAYRQDAATFGVVTRNGWTLSLSKVGAQVQATVISGSGPAAIVSACTGTKEIHLGHAGDAAAWSCDGAGTVTVNAVNAPSTIEVWKKFCGDATCDWEKITLQTGQTASTGSPVTNLGPGSVAVELFDSNLTRIASFQLTSGQSIDVNASTGPGGADHLTVQVASGDSATITVVGQTVTLAGGQPPQTFTIRKANQTITFGQLPNRTYGDPNFTLAAISPALALGVAHTCALTSDGVVYCWGDNSSGQLGDMFDSIALSSSDDPVYAYATSLRGVRAIAAGAFHTCAVTDGGGVKCWGRNDLGQLGDGTTNKSSTPVDVVGLASGVLTIAAGNHHTCALMTSGAVKCWGFAFGPIGSRSLVPVDVSGLGPGVKAITAGFQHACAILTTGAAKCWGLGTSGQLGDGTTSSSATPVDVVGLTNLTAIAAGGSHTCALTTDGGVTCWGNPQEGRLGNNVGSGFSSPPVDVVGLSSGVRSIAAGGLQTCASTIGGAALCWGGNLNGQLGDGTQTDRWVPTPVLGLSTGVASVSTGSQHTCALTADGRVWCWGSNLYRQTGNDVWNLGRDLVPFETALQVGQPVAARATASSGLPITYAASGACTVAGNIVHLTGAGSCAITASQVGDADYNTATDVTQPFSIAPASLVVRADDRSRTYGATSTFTASYIGFVNGDGPASLDGALAFTPDQPARPVGSYAITPSGLTSPNYAITFAPGTLTVTPTPLLVKANDDSRPYGYPNPQFAATYTGFVLGQDQTALGGVLTFATSATITSDVGGYPITLSGLTSSNYAIAFANGLLTVNTAIPTVDGGWTVSIVRVLPHGVRASITGAGTTATIATCPAGGAEHVDLSQAGAAADIVCVDTGGVGTGSHVTAVNQSVVVRDAPDTHSATALTGQTVTVGSPVTASASNTLPILVQLFGHEGATLGSFDLAPAGKVDVQFTAGPNGEDVANVQVLVGTIALTINGQTATLAAGQPARTFSLGARAVMQTVLADLGVVRAGAASKQDGDRLGQAIAYLTKAVDPAFWADALHLRPIGGEQALNAVKDSVDKLVDLTKKSAVAGAALENAIARLLGAARTPAVLAIHDATAAGGRQNQIDQAGGELAAGDADAAAGKFVTAVEHYRNAWTHAAQPR